MQIDRRSLLIGTFASLLAGKHAQANDLSTLFRTIPSSGVKIPAIGMGSWLTFDITPEGPAFETRVKILKEFFKHGGALIDSSPMYGRSEQVIGRCLEKLNFPPSCFSATKVWTTGREAGIAEMETSRTLWKIPGFSLLQIHNLLDWKNHMHTLQDWKEKGRVQYIGITTYGGLRHSEMEMIMKAYPIDFIQLTYNILDREAEQRLLPLAAEKNIGVIANRPFQGGSLFSYVSNKKLPAWAGEIDCNNWAQFFLKYITSHPHITCAIPATSQVSHMQENMGALMGKQPNPSHRAQMEQYFSKIV
ncbi:Aldo/keto reductase [Alteromonadaceae bacterium Bs31]|nr:Aldo/keto reductase [Alteromonadaceae bacterium Bs31]